MECDEEQPQGPLPLWLEGDSLAPYCPTPVEDIPLMLEFAQVKKSDVVYDIGCGDGRVVVLAAEKCGAHAVGIEIDSQLAQKAVTLAGSRGVSDLVTIRNADARELDYSDATVIFVYLLLEGGHEIRPILQKYLDRGARIVARKFPVDLDNANVARMNEYYLYTKKC